MKKQKENTTSISGAPEFRFGASCCHARRGGGRYVSNIVRINPNKTLSVDGEGSDIKQHQSHYGLIASCFKLRSLSVHVHAACIGANDRIGYQALRVSHPAVKPHPAKGETASLMLYHKHFARKSSTSCHSVLTGPPISEVLSDLLY